MTTLITKEQLQQIEAAAKEVLWPIVWTEKKARTHFNEKITPELALELARIALASLETEPEHWKVLNELNLIIGIYNDRESAERKAAEWRTNRIIPLYTAPPAPLGVISPDSVSN